MTLASVVPSATNPKRETVSRLSEPIDRITCTFILFPDKTEERDRYTRVGFAIYVVRDLRARLCDQWKLPDIPRGRTSVQVNSFFSSAKKRLSAYEELVW